MDKERVYPELSEEGIQEAELYLESFREKMKIIANETISKIYTDCLGYIESDSWTNFRNQLMDGFTDYPNAKIRNLYNFKAIRKKMFEEFHDEITEDLNQELLEENKDLKKQIEYLQELRRC